MALQSGVSGDDIAHYLKDGAVLLKGVLSSGELALLERGVEEAFVQRGQRGSRVTGLEGGGETFIENYIYQRCPSLLALMESGVVGEIAGRIMQTSSAQIVLDQIFYKTPGQIVPTAWHQDTPFLRVRGFDLARVWMPCDASPRDLTVQVVRGSHRWNVVYGTLSPDQATAIESGDETVATYTNLGDSRLPPLPDIARYRDSFEILSWDVEPGDALIFQGHMLHGAEGRVHYDKPRRAFATLWAGPDLRYHVPDGKAFPPPGGKNCYPIPEGARLGDHEDAFPALWRESNSAFLSGAPHHIIA